MAPKRPYPGSSTSEASSNEKRSRNQAAPADLSKSIEEARQRAMEAFKRSGLPSAAPSTTSSRPAPRPAAIPPSQPASGARPSPSPSFPQQPSPLPDKSGLGDAQQADKPTGIHPLLLGDAARIQEKFRSLAPKFASIQANKRQLPGRPPPTSQTLSSASSSSSSLSSSSSSLFPFDKRVASAQPRNPYLSNEPENGEGPKRKSMHRALQFHRPGKYILEAEQIRRDEQMQALKVRIQATARKAGIHDELLDDERILRVRMARENISTTCTDRQLAS